MLKPDGWSNERWFLAVATATQPRFHPHPDVQLEQLREARRIQVEQGTAAAVAWLDALTAPQLTEEERQAVWDRNEELLDEGARLNRLSVRPQVIGHGDGGWNAGWR